MSIEFKIDTPSGLKKVVCANNWHELTAEQLIKIELHSKEDILGLFCIVTGMEVEIAEKAKNKNLELAVYAVVSFIFKPPDWENLKHSPKFIYKNKTYNVPNDFGVLCLGQKILLGQLSRDEKNVIEKITEVVALCMQPIIDSSDYDSKRVQKIAKDLEQENGLVIYSLAKFFFICFPNFLNTGKNYSTTSQQAKPANLKFFQSLLMKNA